MTRGWKRRRAARSQQPSFSCRPGTREGWQRAPCVSSPPWTQRERAWLATPLPAGSTQPPLQHQELTAQHSRCHPAAFLLLPLLPLAGGSAPHQPLLVCCITSIAGHQEETTYHQQQVEFCTEMPQHQADTSLPTCAQTPALPMEGKELQRSRLRAEYTWSNTVTLITMTDTAG